MILDITNLIKTTNKVYLPYYANKDRYLVFYGSAGSGKSRFIGQKILLRILGEEKHRILIVRKVATTLEKSVFKLMIDYIHKYGLSKYFKINKSSKVITCTLNNNEIYFLGMDDREKLKSIEGITSIWAEEASELDFDDFTQLDLRLRGYTKNYKQFILSFNPVSQKSWLKKYFFDNEVENCTILKTTYKDNEYIDEQYKQVLENLKYTNPEYYKIYALGEWGVLKGRIFDDYEEIESYPNIGINDEVFGADFGTANPSAIVRIGINHDKKILYLDEYVYEAGLTREELARKVKSNYPELLGIAGYGDNAEPHSIKTFNKFGFTMYPCVKDKLGSIDFVKSYKVKITKRSKNLKSEWENYIWKLDKEGNPTDIPVKENDHAIDAVLYGAYSHWGVIYIGGVATDKRMYEIKRKFELIEDKPKKYINAKKRYDNF